MPRRSRRGIAPGPTACHRSVMRWASALSQDPGTPQAVAEAVAALRRELGGERADLVVAFVSPHHRAAAADIPALVAAELPGALLVGCTGGGVIGAGHEVEERAAVSLTAAALPGVDLVPFHLDTTDLPAASAPPPAWHAAIAIAPQARPKLLLLACGAMPMAACQAGGEIGRAHV